MKPKDGPSNDIARVVAQAIVILVFTYSVSLYFLTSCTSPYALCYFM